LRQPAAVICLDLRSAGDRAPMTLPVSPVCAAGHGIGRPSGFIAAACP